MDTVFAHLFYKPWLTLVSGLKRHLSTAMQNKLPYSMYFNSVAISSPIVEYTKFVYVCLPWRRISTINSARKGLNGLKLAPDSAVSYSWIWGCRIWCQLHVGKKLREINTTAYIDKRMIKQHRCKTMCLSKTYSMCLFFNNMLKCIVSFSLIK